jgi:O-antigen/teichoic acid export membrane protein
LRNTVALSAPRLLGYVLSFVSAPVIVDALGLRNFGIWALTGALAQYGSLLDLGVGISLSRYIAAHRHDRHRCGEYMAVGWLSVAVIAVVLGACATAGAPAVSDALHGISLSEVRVLLYSSVVLLCCSMLQGVIAAYPIGRSRMVVPNVGIAIGAVINFVASVGSLALGAELPGYAIANAGAGILTVGVLAGLVVRAEGRLPLGRPQLTTVRAFMSFSVKNQLVAVANLLNYQTDKVIIALSVGPAAAGAYELANRVALAVREVGIYAASAVNIELTTLAAQSGFDRVRARYGRLTVVTAALGFPPMLLAIATAPLLLESWLVHAPPDAVAVLVGLSAAYLLSASTGVGYGVAVAAAEPGIVARTSVGAAVANIVLTATLAPFFGLYGILAGTVVALTAGSIAQLVLVHRRFELPAAAYRHAVGPALCVYAALAAPVAAFAYAGPLHNRGEEAGALLVLCVTYLIACGTWAGHAQRLPSVITNRIPLLW